MTKVTIFNAPSRTGKGEACKHLCKVFSSQNPVHMEFKDELFKVAASILEISVEEFLYGYDLTLKEYYKDDTLSLNYALMAAKGDEASWIKDLPMYEIDGKVYSKREWLIHVSENVIKPSFGKDAFGKMFANNIPEEGFVFCSDGGFKEEIQAVIDKVGADNVLIVQIEREGCNFNNDSRTLLSPEDFDNKILFLNVANNSSISGFKLRTEILVKCWLGVGNL